MLHVIGFDGASRALEPTAEAIWPLMEEGVQLNLSSPPPDPFKAGVRYRRERRKQDGSREDRFLPWWSVKDMGAGDCEDLASWLAARLRYIGDSSSRVGLVEFPMGGWHAVTMSKRKPLRLDEVSYRAEIPAYRGAHVYGGPDIGWDPKGWWITDPSFGLGMRDAARTSRVYHANVNEWEKEPEISGVSDVLNSPWTWAGALAAAVAVYMGTRSIVGQVDVVWDPKLLPWANRLSEAFRKRWIEIADELESDPRFGLAIMRAESNFDPAVVNCSTAATGLIQFLPSTLVNLGSNTCKARAMTALQQLELVRKYFMPAKGRLKTLTDWYTWTFRPKDMGQPDTYVHFRSPNQNYINNKSLDVNNDGMIQKWEPAAKAAALLASEEQRGKTGVSGAPSLEELLTELEEIGSVHRLSSYISKLKLLAPNSMLETLNRWERAVLSLPLDEGKNIGRNLTHQALQKERSFDPGAVQTMKNAITAVIHSPGQAVQSMADVVTDLASPLEVTQEGKPRFDWTVPAIMLGAGGALVWGVFRK